MKLRIYNTGYCESFERMAIQGGQFKKIKFPSIYGLIEHPEKGNILFDTGYSDRIKAATKHFPQAIYNWILPPKMDGYLSAVDQLKQLHIDPNDVDYIIVSHFHADHICGLIDFPKATIICSTSAFDHLQSLKSTFKAIKQAVLLDLIPTDLAERVWLFDNDASISVKTDPILGKVFDLFNDSSIQLCHLPGHMTGQIGALLNANEQNYFLIADACWLAESYRNNTPPSFFVRQIIHHYDQFLESLQKVHLYHKSNPNCHIIPTHCEKTVERHVS